MTAAYWSLLVCCFVCMLNRYASSSVALPKHPACGVSELPDSAKDDNANIAQFPWTTRIEYQNTDSEAAFLCDGALINERYVLTAAHCVTRLPTKWKINRVILGEWDSSTHTDCDGRYCAEPVINRTVDTIVPHEEYAALRGRAMHDLALIRLSSDVTFSDTVKPICLPQQDSDMVGNAGLVVGWLRKEDSKKAYSHVRIQNAEVCGPLYKGRGIVLNSTKLCAKELVEQDNCGNGASPMLVQQTGNVWYLLGIFSFGPTCGPDLPNVYTNVSAYVNWIKNTIY